MLEKYGIGSDMISTLGFLGFFFIVGVTIAVIWKYVQDMKGKQDTSVPLAEENWDGLREYKNELPTGWFIVFFGLMFWVAWYYLAGYPLNAYSQIGEYNDEVKAYNAKFEKKWANADKDTLKAMGESIFLTSCAPCHGQTGDGINGKAANLMKWGNAEAIVHTVKNGSKGLGFPLGEMPANLTDEAGAKKAAAFVLNQLSEAKMPADAALVTEGKAVYDSVCAACHGADGKGNGDQAPNLTLYGTPKFISDVVLVRGKKGMIGSMPSFEKSGTMTKLQYSAVATYVNSEMNNAKK